MEERYQGRWFNVSGKPDVYVNRGFVFQTDFLNYMYRNKAYKINFIFNVSKNIFKTPNYLNFYCLTEKVMLCKSANLTQIIFRL